jgi:peroxisomal membrane protein 2
VLVGALQRAFAGKTSGKAKLAQILASNLIVAPIQTVGVCMSYNQWRIQVS